MTGFLSPLPIFEVISFFATASFVAWLGYAPLQRERLKDETDEQSAKENLLKITNYFLVSFLCFTIAIAATYLLHHPSIVFSDTEILNLLQIVLGITFVFGALTLLVPMLALRKMGRKLRDPGRRDIRMGFADLNTSDFNDLLFTTVFMGLNILFWYSLVGMASIPPIQVEKTYLIGSGIFPLIGAICLIVFGDVRGSRMRLAWAALNVPVALIVTSVILGHFGVKFP